MKVILLKDVARVGTKGSVAVVPDGFAQNKLIPQRLAEPATPANLKKVERLQADAEASKGALAEGFNTAIAALKAQKLSLEVEANDQGHLFKAVSAEDIAQAAKKESIEVDAALVQIDVPIKSVGEHEVKLMSREMSDSFTIEVVSK